MAGLSYGDYTADEAADVLIDGITGVICTVIKRDIDSSGAAAKTASPVFKNGVNMDFDKTIGVYLENTEWKGRTDIGCC